MKFYLGTHRPGWVNKYPMLPLFISCRCILKRKSQLKGDWIIDSAGFTELMKNGCYKISEDEYVECIYNTKPKTAFSQDWMCEDVILQKTGKTIKEHQELTCRNYISLKKKCKIIQPVLQGWSSNDYVNHIKMYKSFNVDINQLFGVGTICKRNTSPEIILKILSNIKNCDNNIRLHGFGLKITSLREKRIKKLLYSADSMAWSFAGRHKKLGCDGCNLASCANCFKYAMLWRENLINRIE